MLAIPPAILELLHVQAGATVNLNIENGRLVVRPQSKTRYTLDELLAQCDPAAPVTDEDREWIDMPPVGREL
jgi:antitoxin ChpS